MKRFLKSKAKKTSFVQKVGDQAVEFQTSSSSHVQKHLTRRFGRVVGVKRFLVGWLLLVSSLILLSGATIFQLHSLAYESGGTEGGTYVEGMSGTINNLNPLFASGVLDQSTSRLLFNGLLRYDTQGNLVGDLAKDWAIGEDKKSYTVNLRKDVLWHDGQPLKAEDVIFTIRTIQNPDTRSTLQSSWQGVTVAANDEYTVTFTLPATLAAFPEALTVPILPAHLLAEVPAEMLRTTEYSTNPVGTGPFTMQVLRTDEEQQQLELRRNEKYHRGAPKVDRFVIKTFMDDDAMKSALEQREITAAVGLGNLSSQDLLEDSSIRVNNIPLYSGLFAFFKTSNPLLSDAKVRTALVNAIDRQVFLEKFNAQYPPLKTPLLPSQLGFNGDYDQKTDLAAAATLLDQAGWVKQANGIRAKDGTAFSLDLVTVDSEEQMMVATELQKQWQEIGVEIKPRLLSQEQLRQTALATHDYDILLYGISIGHDPDVYAYWHSSQAQPGANNFSEWKSPRADISLDVARTRVEPLLRAARYQTFQDEWRIGSPALALYQLQTTYAVHQNATGFKVVPSTNAADRLTNVEDWTVATKSVLRTP